jgi:pyruvate dehydrogenase (quinone)
MSKNVADVMWSLLHAAGVRRCYGIVGDALNPTIEAMDRNGGIEFIHVRHEEYGGFAAVAEAYLSREPVAICGTAGPGVTHLINAMLDARKEAAPIIVIAGDVETELVDSGTLEELNPYHFFQSASLYTGRIIDPNQARSVIQTAIRTAVAERGPTVISLPGNIAHQKVDVDVAPVFQTSRPVVRPGEAEMRALAAMINDAESVAIFGGDGCRDAHDEVVELATKLQAPVGYSYRGKQHLEYENPNACGMTGLIGFGGAYRAINDADLLLMLGTDFPFSHFLPGRDVKQVQIDLRAQNIGRRTAVDLGLVGDIRETVSALLPLVTAKTNRSNLSAALALTREWDESLQHYVRKAESHGQIRPEYLVATLDRLAADDAYFSVDTGTACIWGARYLKAARKRNIFGSFSWASMANAAPNAMGAQLLDRHRQTIAICGDGGFTMLGLGDLLTLVEQKLPVVLVILNNQSLDFVRIEQQEAGFAPTCVDFQNPNFAEVAKAMGAKGLRVERSQDVESVLREALAHRDGPVVVDAVIDPFALSVPSDIPVGVAAGFTLSAWKQVASGHAGTLLGEVAHNIGLAGSPGVRQWSKK